MKDAQMQDMPQQEILGSPYECVQCHSTFQSKQDFVEHCLVCVLKTSSKKREKKIVYPRLCSKCKTFYGTRFEYYRHMSECGQDRPSSKKILSKTKCVVIGCTQLFFHRTRMFAHLVKDHGNDAMWHEYKLKSKTDFEIWRQEIDEGTSIPLTAPIDSTKADNCTHSELDHASPTHVETAVPNSDTLPEKRVTMYIRPCSVFNSVDCNKEVDKNVNENEDVDEAIDNYVDESTDEVSEETVDKTTNGGGVTIAPDMDMEMLRSKCLNFLDDIRSKIESSSSLTMLQYMSNQLRISNALADCSLKKSK